MSTINNIPFDINRTAMEKNATVKATGTVPVYHSDAIRAIDNNTQNPERRRGGDRRHLDNGTNHNNSNSKRLLIERREDAPLSKHGGKAAETLENAHAAGSIIDLEV
ncbi:MAG: hypothetical protein ACI9N9_001085 [Enterobacterales bacterium]|jgi:hypothetical protein